MEKQIIEKYPIRAASSVISAAITGAIGGWIIGFATIHINSVGARFLDSVAVFVWSMAYYALFASLISLPVVAFFLIVSLFRQIPLIVRNQTAAFLTIITILLPFAVGTSRDVGVSSSLFTFFFLSALSVLAALVIVLLGTRVLVFIVEHHILRPTVLLSTVGALIVAPFALYLSESGIVSPRMPVEIQRSSEEITPLIAVGWDAAGWEILAPLSKMGKAPVVGRLSRTGVSGRCETLSCGESLLIWTTVATGKLPHNHGILDWLYHSLPGCSAPLYHGPAHTGFDRLFDLLDFFSLSSAKVPDAKNRRAAALWTIANNAGRRALVLNWWATWPVERIDGTMITNYFFPLEEKVLRQKEDVYRSSGTCLIHPSQLGIRAFQTWEDSKLLAQESFPEISGFSVSEMGQMKDPIPLQSSWILALDLATAATARDCLVNDPYDLSMIYFRGLDIVQHFFWKYFQPHDFPSASVTQDEITRFGSIIPNWYMMYDSMLGKLIDSSETACNWIILSDHFMEPEMKKNPYNKSGQHARGPAGMFLASGPSFRQNEILQGLRIVDVCPTMLQLLGLPPDSQADGRVIVDALRHPTGPNSRTILNPVNYDHVDGDSVFCEIENDTIDDQAVQENLRQLGYIE